MNLKLVWTEFWTNFSSIITNTVSIIDLIDILVVAYVFYQAIKLVRETRAMQLVKGIAAVLVVYLIANQAKMITLTFFMRNIIQVGLFALVVVFQPELRRALEQVGRTKISSIGKLGGTDSEEQAQQKIKSMIDAVVESAAYLSEHKTGALMVIERDIRLGEIVNTGTVLDSQPSMELITNIFFPNSPMHDGAMVLRQGRLHAAGCFLPLSSNMEVARELGTRHRAALGMSEVSDALIVVVSEETGAITVAMDSKLQRGLSSQNLSKLLQAKLLNNKAAENAAKRGRFWRKKDE